MSCFNLSSVNAKNSPVLPSHFPSQKSWEALEKQVLENFAERSIEQKSCVKGVCRAALTVLIALSLVLGSSVVLAGVCVSSSVLPIIGIVGSVLLAGACMIFYRLSHKRDIFANTNIPLFGKKEWLASPLCVYRKGNPKAIEEKRRTASAEILQGDYYTDLSTLDSSKSGIALSYIYPSDASVRCSICFSSFFFLPLVVAIKMAYNAARFFLIPFYVIFRMVLNRCTRIEREDVDFCCADIARECGRSLANCLRSPFYGTAFAITLLYSLLDPLAGRVATACVERDWNDDIIRSRGIWLVVPQRNFAFEGNGKRHGLGQFSWYVLGCFQPAALFLFKNGRIISGVQPSKQAYPEQDLRVFHGPITMN